MNYFLRTICFEFTEIFTSRAWWDLSFPSVAGYVTKVTFAKISWVQIVWISAGLSMLTKTLTIQIAIMLPLIFSISQLLYSFFWPAKFLPDLATMNL